MSEPAARPASQVWCLFCRAFRSYRSEPVPPASRHHTPVFDTDYLVCTGCGTSLLLVRAPAEQDNPE